MDGKYTHVVLVGIDGAGNFFKNTDMPTIREMFEKGAGTDRCLTSIPTISAECWGSMLIGVYPEIHNLNNDIVSRCEYSLEEHPTIFKLIRNAYPDAVLSSYSNWSPINSGIVERGIGVNLDTGEDARLTEKICEHIKKDKPNFLFIQFDSIDGAGHTFGYGSEKYLEELSAADTYVRKIWDAIKEAGIEDDTLLIATADHGGLDHSHGGTSEEEKFVFFVAVGNTVIPGAKINIEVKDIPAVIAYALGVPGSENWQAKLPEGMFRE